MKLLLSVPSTFEILLAAMSTYDVGSYGRKNEIKRHAEKMRQDMGV